MMYTTVRGHRKRPLRHDVGAARRISDELLGGAYPRRATTLRTFDNGFHKPPESPCDEREEDAEQNDAEEHGNLSNFRAPSQSRRVPR